MILFADTGAGSGKPVTPYRDKETINAARVESVRREVNGLKAVEQVAVNGRRASQTGYKVGFACAADGKFSEAPRFSFRGHDGTGAAREIALADAEDFRLVAVTGNDATIEVTQFPAISPAELLKAQPNYTTLVKDWKRTVQLRMPLACTNGELSMVGTDWDTETKYRVLFRVRDMKVGTPVVLKSTAPGKGYWWAIPSVTADKAYPHRVVMKK